MTITNTVSKQSYVTTGATTVWPFSFPLDRDGDLTVILTAPDGVETLVSPAQYRVERSSGAPGGTVTLPLSGPALGTGQTVTLLRRLPVTQATSLVTGAAFYAEDLERALDRQTMIAQQQQEQIDRCIKMAVSDPAGLALTLPPLAQRAGKSLKFDGSGALVPTQFDPDTQQAAAAASATAAAGSAAAAAADRAGAEAAAVTATTARDTAVASASAAAAAAASIGQETVEAVTAHRTAGLADRGKVFAVNAAAGPVTITLPPIASVGEPFRLTVKKTDATANKVSVAVSGSDTLDGGTAALQLDRQGAGVRLDSDIDPSPDNWVSQAFGVAVGDATPVGVQAWFTGTAPPPGWLVLNGALVSRAVYPELWAHVNASGMATDEASWQAYPSNRAKFSRGDGSTSFRLPDLITDGLFIRAQNPADASFGRREEDEIKSHTHLTQTQTSGYTTGSASGPLVGGTVSGSGGATQATGGTETRPKNAGRLPIIKAFSVPVDTQSIDVAALANQVTALANNTGKVLQQVRFESAALFTASAQIPFDDTIPQNTEGAEWATLAITPKRADSVLVIEVALTGTAQNGGQILTIALFKNSDANALAVVGQQWSGAGGMTAQYLRKAEVSGSTAARTYRVRVGGDAASAPVSINGFAGARRWGGAAASSITITELAP